MNQTMNAIGLRRYGAADVLEPLEVARPAVGPETVLIRVVAAGVNPADWRFRKGQFRLLTRLPFVPGSDVAGIVAEVGSAVTGVRPGDAVYAMLPAMRGGGYAEYARVAASAVAPLPATITFAQGAAVPLTALTALQALRDKARLQPGMRVLINGAAGGVGTFAVQIAKALGAHVTAVCSGRNADLVRELGADAVIDYTQQDVPLHNQQYDVLFDAVNVATLQRWSRLLRRGGVFVSVNPIFANPVAQLIATLRGWRVASVLVRPSRADLATIGAWIDAGQVRPVIDRSYALADAAAAHRQSETQRVRGKLVLIVDEQMAQRAGVAVTAAPRTELAAG